VATIDELEGTREGSCGALTGDAKLKRQGRVEQMTGKVKQKAEKVIDKVKDALE
jgi:uncharacterized protein YjbJ (UPF0337 family)